MQVPRERTSDDVATKWADRTKEYFRFAYQDGYEDGFKKAKEQFGSHERGVAHFERATEEQIEKWGIDLAGWCTECGKPIEGRWIQMANFCPYCGRVIEWKELM